MKRIVSETKKKEFVEKVMSFMIENEWTISNLEESITEVEIFMKENAVLKELTIQQSTQLEANKTHNYNDQIHVQSSTNDQDH